MKIILLGKKAKFAMLLSMASLLGLQSGQAVLVNCPSPDAITINSQIADKGLAIEGTTRSSNQDFRLTMLNHVGGVITVPPNSRLEGYTFAGTHKIGDEFACIYKNSTTKRSASLHLTPVGYTCIIVGTGVDSYFDCTKPG